MRRLAGAAAAEKIHVHGVADGLGFGRQVGATGQLWWHWRLLRANLLRQFGEGRADLAHALAKGLDIAAWHRDIEVADLRVAVGRQHPILLLRRGVVGLAGWSAQVQGEDLDLLAQCRLAYLGFVHLGAAVRVVLAQRAGIADQQDQAPAITRPVHAFDGLHDSGEGIFVEGMAGYRGRLHLFGGAQETLRIAAFLQADQGLAQVLQARRARRAVAITDQTEADVVQLTARLQLALQLADHLAHAVDVGLHRHRGVDHQHDAGAEA